MNKVYQIYKEIEDGKYIQAIKDIRTVCGFDLREAKEIIELMRDNHKPHIMYDLSTQLIDGLRIYGFNVCSSSDTLPDELFIFGEPSPDKRFTYSYGVLQIVTDEFSYSIKLTEQDRITLIRELNEE